MTTESETDRQGEIDETPPIQSKAPWKTPHLVVHGTITVRTLGKSAGLP
jgi:hypothetical protein